MPAESKAAFKLKVSNSLKEYYENIDEDTYIEWTNKISQSVKCKWNNMTEEEKEQEINKFVKRIKERSQEEKNAQYAKSRKTFAKKSHKEKLESYRKSVITKKKNGTLNTSKQEKDVEKCLMKKFNCVKTQYNDERYPFNCDFYIPEKDLFIECNFHWTHGPHAFNKNNPNDIELLSVWKEKSITSKFYTTAISVWTSRDINKFSYVNKNNLNYLAFYSIEDFYDWLTTV